MSALPTLRAEPADSIDERWARCRELISEIAGLVGRKVFADRIGLSESSFSNAIAQRDRHRLPGVAVLVALELAPTDDLLELLASVRGRGVCQLGHTDERDASSDLLDALLAVIVRAQRNAPRRADETQLIDVGLRREPRSAR